MKASNVHGVWKSQKKSHSTLRAKRAMFTFWVDKSYLKMPKIVHFGEFLKTWSKRSNSVTRQVSFNSTKIGGKGRNSKIQMRHFGWFSKKKKKVVDFCSSLCSHFKKFPSRFHWQKNFWHEIFEGEALQSSWLCYWKVRFSHRVLLCPLGSLFMVGPQNLLIVIQP